MTDVVGDRTTSVDGNGRHGATVGLSQAQALPVPPLCHWRAAVFRRRQDSRWRRESVEANGCGTVRLEQGASPEVKLAHHSRAKGANSPMVEDALSTNTLHRLENAPELYRHGNAKTL
jgi:hypothetical protein